jgi:DNA-binding MarR family transcriptional regulator
LLADKRRIALDVTPAGRALLAEAPKTVQRQLIEGLAALPVDRQIELADLMEQWLQASGVDLAHPPMIGEEGAHGSARRFE